MTTVSAATRLTVARDLLREIEQRIWWNEQNAKLASDAAASFRSAGDAEHAVDRDRRAAEAKASATLQARMAQVLVREIRKGEDAT